MYTVTRYIQTAMSARLQSAARENAARGKSNFARVQRARSKHRSPARAGNTKGKTLIHHAYKGRDKKEGLMPFQQQSKKRSQPLQLKQKRK